MYDPDLVVNLTPKDIEESWAKFHDCENSGHIWRKEPDSSVFYQRCQKCGGAEGIKFN